MTEAPVISTETIEALGGRPEQAHSDLIARGPFVVLLKGGVEERAICYHLAIDNEDYRSPSGKSVAFVDTYDTNYILQVWDIREDTTNHMLHYRGKYVAGPYKTEEVNVVVRPLKDEDSEWFFGERLTVAQMRKRL